MFTPEFVALGRWLVRLDMRPDFFSEDGFFQVVPRDNYDCGLPLALMRCESKGMLKDRVYAIR